MSKNLYFEHDPRGTTSAGKFRASGGMGKNRKYRDVRGFSKPHFDFDGDVDMNGPHSSGGDRRFNPYGQRNNDSRRKHKCAKHNKHRNDNSLMNHDGWFKITIPHGKKSGKDFILNTVKSLCKCPFVPYNFQFIGGSAEFYVREYASAVAIRDLNRKVTTPDGFKMLVHLSKCNVPVATMDDDIVTLIKACMSRRYDVPTHSLNLAKFHHDESLKSNMLYLPLHKPLVFNAVVKIIKANIPEIESLNLSDNKLYTIETMAHLVPVCKNLKSLSLCDNKIRSISELNHLKGLDILDLFLDGNPLCDSYKDHTSYISDVRERLPKLIRLDGHELPPPIGFDLGPETIPPSKKSFLAAEDVKDMVIQFLDQYYSIYDSGDRSKLLDAYHDQACFSLCLSKNTQKGSTSLGIYASENRNLLRVCENNMRCKLLKQGKLSVVTALSELPQTMHDPTSFSVDIFHISPGLMSFSVIGVFKEVGADINNAAVKTFSRTFVVVAQNPGFVIVNETLFIAHASQDQQQKAFKVPAPTPSPSPAPSTEEKSASEKQLMVIELSKQTGMNIDFSTKCLEENDWDYQRAVAVFMKFQSEGKLPPEAFMTV